MKYKIFIISLIIICMCGMIGCDSSQAAEVKQLTFDSTVSDKIYKESEKISNSNLEKAKNLTSNKEKSVEGSVIKEQGQEQLVIEEPVIEESIVEESIVEEPVVEEQKIESYNTNGLTQESGVNYYDGRTETYYSSNILYHQDTDQWTVDDEGFYRTDEGYYVVAASDIEEGTTFEGSKGTCIVLDSGCDEGTTDYYVNW